MAFIIIIIASVVSGIVQGVTGFGTGLVMMMVLPYFFPLPQSAALSVAIALAICAVMFWRYRKDVELKKALIPGILFVIAGMIAIRFSTIANPNVIKVIFGIFLLVLCVYYLFFQKAKKVGKMKLPVAVICIAVAGICDGMFGIGGPLMVLYFLSNTKTTREYLGTVQTFLFVCSIYTTFFRAFSGILVPSQVPYLFVGWAGILIGAFISTHIVDRINADMLRRLVYIMIGVSGFVNLFQAIRALL